MSNEESESKRVCEIDRNQFVLRPVDVDKLVGPTDPVRGIWELVGRLDIGEFYTGIKSVQGRAGRDAHDPHLLICLWVYAYSEGIGSAREISRRCETDPGFQWLTGLGSVNHHTLSDFKIAHGERLHQLFVQILGVLSAQGLVSLKRITHDGTKIRSCAGGDTFRREHKLRAHLNLARQQIRKLEQEDEQAQENSRKKAAQQRAWREREERLKNALEELKDIRQHSDKAAQECRASWSDPESRVMKQADGGYRPSYNVQISTDADNGVIVGMQVSQSSSDAGLLVPALECVEKNFGKLPEQVVVDGAFINGETIVAVDQKNVELIGPVTEPESNGALVQHGIDADFSLSAFKYDPIQDCFICPADKELRYRSKEKHRGGFRWRYQARAADCTSCRFKKVCCPKASRGRMVMRQVDDEAVILFREKMQTEQAKAIYKVRGAVAEFSNLWIKEKIGLRQFRVRGLSKVKIEALWACLTCNIQCWLRLCWKPRIMEGRPA